MASKLGLAVLLGGCSSLGSAQLFEFADEAVEKLTNSPAFLEKRRLNEALRANASEAVDRLAKGEAQEAKLEDYMLLWQQELAQSNITEPYNISTYDGIDWPSFSHHNHHLSAMSLSAGGGSVHVFAIGDWGAILPNHYTAPNKRGGARCPNCPGYVKGIDDRAQILVANQVNARASRTSPQYVLNPGDNFYWSGLTFTCGQGSAGAAMGAFAAGWQSMYPSLAGKPWLSVLGNHDYGGYQFNHAWDWQIKYSFSNPNWVMPARYYSRTMTHQGFSVEYFMIDTNNFDAHEPEFDPEHNICSGEHNPGGASCASVGGPASTTDCKNWFWSSYRAQQSWLEQKLAASTADWQVVVTHFPCGTDAGWFAKLHKSLGLDLLVTGHRHDQEVWAHSGALGGMTCIVAGGGGGITSEGSPSGSGANGQYGFFDLTISKDTIIVESINLNGEVIEKTVVTPS